MLGNSKIFFNQFPKNSDVIKKKLFKQCLDSRRKIFPRKVTRQFDAEVTDVDKGGSVREKKIKNTCTYIPDQTTCIPITILQKGEVYD